MACHDVVLLRSQTSMTNIFRHSWTPRKSAVWSTSKFWLRRPREDVRVAWEVRGRLRLVIDAQLLDLWMDWLHHWLCTHVASYCFTILDQGFNSFEIIANKSFGSLTTLDQILQTKVKMLTLILRNHAFTIQVTTKRRISVFLGVSFNSKPKVLFLILDYFCCIASQNHWVLSCAHWEDSQSERIVVLLP